MRILWMALLTLTALSVAALECRTCHRRITADPEADEAGNAYCSRACLEQMLPHCVVCNALCETSDWSGAELAFCSEKCLAENPYPHCSVCDEIVREYVTMKTPAGNRIFCRLCVGLPRCLRCNLPCDGLETGNFQVFCAECAETPEVAAVVARYGLAEAQAATVPVCDYCGVSCRAFEVSVGEQSFCSFDCARQAAPRCRYCKNPCIERIGGGGGGNALQGYCSEVCYKQGNLPTCGKCSRRYDPELTGNDSGYCSWCSRLTRQERGHSKRRSYEDRVMDRLEDFLF